MHNTLVRRFHKSDQIIHFVNAFCWIALGVTGCLLCQARLAGVFPSRQVLAVHLLLGTVLCCALLLFALFAHARLKRLLWEILRCDRPCSGWLRKLGGYPKKLFGIPLKPGEIPEQGRFNAGQKFAYGILIACNILLIANGFALFFLHQPVEQQSSAYQLMLNVHGACFMLAVGMLIFHIPMGLLSSNMLRAIQPFHHGLVPIEDMRKTASLWVKQDLETEAGQDSVIILPQFPVCPILDIAPSR